VPYFGRVFLMLTYTDITQNTLDCGLRYSISAVVVAPTIQAAMLSECIMHVTSHIKYVLYGLFEGCATGHGLNGRGSIPAGERVFSSA
jgi:hypothetical protein